MEIKTVTPLRHPPGAGIYSDDPEVLLLREKGFVDGLGKHATELSFGYTRIELLSRYLQALEQRTRWCGMNPDEIKNYVRRSIAREAARVDTTNG